MGYWLFIQVLQLLNIYYYGSVGIGSSIIFTKEENSKE